MAEDKNPKKVEVTKTGTPLVFISHDNRDAKLAEAFSGLLKSVSAGVLKSFWSSDKKGNQGIEYGIEWYSEIIKNIQYASDVVCPLTQRSVNRPWILFEAGVAKGTLETPILGVALGISLKDASSGPFAQFQNCADDEESLTKLVFQLVDRIPNSEPDEETIKFQVGKFKNTIAEILTNDNSTNDNEISDLPNRDNSSAKLFEEIKVMFQDLPSRITNNMHPENKNRKKGRFHPMMVGEMLHMSENLKVGILVTLGMTREVMPWLYDVGFETLRKIDSDCNCEEKELALFEFQDVITLSTRHPSMHWCMDSKEDFMLFKDILRMLKLEMERYMHSKLE